ncbi:unnamed protein product [Schistosoma turkestanicum]|nr:unnamed protein product [Schistosoma turkestanicum]
MTSIEFGGGPSLSQRQKFSNLEEGGHVPGYMGFCPQFKYRYGHSFGKETADIAKDLPYHFGPRDQHHANLYPIYNANDKFDYLRSSFQENDDHVKLLPKPTGDNKYMERMMSGYSGDVPHMQFKFGHTYQSLADECVDQLVREYKYAELKQKQLNESANLSTNLYPISKDPLVKNRLNLWADDMSLKKSSTELPITGYKGFIPRMETTETGLAKRFHNAAQDSLETFRSELKNHFDYLNTPVTRIDTSSQTSTISPLKSYHNDYSGRIFRREGMIPDYEGHVHGYQYHVGKNFSDTTRDLEVCAHPYPCYGDYLKVKDLTTTK